jgi:hypothetical protein
MVGSFEECEGLGKTRITSLRSLRSPCLRILIWGLREEAARQRNYFPVARNTRHLSTRDYHASEISGAKFQLDKSAQNWGCPFSPL